MVTPSKKQEGKYFEAVGRRKTAISRARLFLDTAGGIVVNEQPLDKYFPTAALRKIANEALLSVSMNKVYVTAHIKGGGIHAQAEALRHSISRAILKVDPEQRKTLKRLGYLKRDPRAKERRKFGLKKARKAPQWAKR